MRPGQPPNRIVRCLLSSCLLAAISGGTMVLVRQRSLGVPLLPSTGCEAAIKNRVPATLCDGPADQPAHRAGNGRGRNARASGTRSRAFSDCPWQFTLENCQLATSVIAIIVQQALSSNVFAEPTLRQNVAPRNRKTLHACEQAVEDATSLWNAEEKQEKIYRCGSLGMTLQSPARCQRDCRPITAAN
jgi:hypothetical protein